jgi:uncharacterized membrane protein
VIAIGLLGRLLHLGFETASSRQIIGDLLRGQALEFKPLHTPKDFLAGAVSFQPDAVMALGLVMLISLPVVRVGMTVILFLFEKDWVFLLITLVVFSVLLFGIIFGQAL